MASLPPEAITNRKVTITPDEAGTKLTIMTQYTGHWAGKHLDFVTVTDELPAATDVGESFFEDADAAALEAWGGP